MNMKLSNRLFNVTIAVLTATRWSLWWDSQFIQYRIFTDSGYDV